MQTVRLDRRATRVIPEFQVSWDPQGTLGHREQMELQELLGHQESRDHRGKKVRPAPKAPLDYREPQEQKAKRAETGSRVPLESRAKPERRVCQDQRAPEDPRASRDTRAILAPLAPGESLVPWGRQAGKGRQEKMVTLDPPGHRVPEVRGACRARTDHLDLRETGALQETQARRATKEKTAARDSLASWVPEGLRESRERKECQARRVSLGSPENQDPKASREIPGSKVTKELPVGMASLGTRESQATKATRA